MPYPEVMVAPMRQELTSAGVTELRDAAAVDAFFNESSESSESTLVLINSVCGCAAGSARPAFKLSMDHGRKPRRFATVFAGQDLEATERMRAIIGDVPPSSPSLALMKNGELIHFVPRHLIEGRDAQSIATDLKSAFDRVLPEEE
jgi:putative YphP/YqiW family bacilliredoxin